MQLTNYEENPYLRRTNYEIRMADPVIQKYTPQIVTGEPGLKWVLTVSMGFYIGEGQARKAIYAKLYGPIWRVKL